MKNIQPALVLLASIGFALSPFLAPGFNGYEPDQFPVPQDSPPAQPAGYAFAIWGVIYLWLSVGAGFGLLKRADDPEWTAMRFPLIASLGIGIFWLPVAQASPFWSTVMIWVMLITSLTALMRAGRYDRWVLRSPIALYAGWLTAASAVALALMLAGHGVLGETTAAVICLSLALGIAVVVQTFRPDTPEYSMAVIWAFVAVAVANIEPLNTSVLLLALAGIAILIALSLREMRHS